MALHLPTDGTSTGNWGTLVTYVQPTEEINALRDQLEKWKRQVGQERRVADEARSQGDLLNSKVYVLALLAVVKCVELGHQARFAHTDCCVCSALAHLKALEATGAGKEVGR
jgi:hypothetical protein